MSSEQMKLYNYGAGPEGRAYPVKEIEKYVTGLKKQGRQSRNLFPSTPGTKIKT
jgi:hypothetical protein